MSNFWDRVDKSDNCWIWQGPTSNKKYGSLSVGGIPKLAHRYSWELSNGEIPKGMCICHKCDNMLCVNPEHLFIGTHADNIADKISKGREARGSKNGRSKLKESDIIRIKELKSEGYSIRDIAEEFGVSKMMISLIVRNKFWTHV